MLDAPDARVGTAHISIVVPTLNESAVIDELLTQLSAWRAHGHELIIVDGQSIDRTADVAEMRCDRFIQCASGRARQMNSGAALASGELILFLHADTTLPLHAMAELQKIADMSKNSWGRFDVAIDASAPIFRVIETLMNWRSRFTGIATGDQAIFVSRRLFDDCGGFPALELMEDIALTNKLRQYSAPICLRHKVLTSARRWQKFGVMRTIITMWLLRAAFYFGVPSGRLRAYYDAPKVTND